MKFLDRIREWVSASDDDKIVMDRRAFLRGMTVTSAGLLVARPSIFDLGRARERRIIELDYSGIEQRVAAEVPVGSSYGFDGYYVITGMSSTGNLLIERSGQPLVRTVRS